MNKLLVIYSALMLAVAAVMALPASARDDPRDQGRHSQSDRGDHRGDSDRHDRNHGNDHDRHDRHGRNDGYRDNRYNRNRHENRRYWANHRYHASHYLAPRGYRYNRWIVGARLPYGYYGRNYYVDYRSYGLAPPPRGYMWVRVAGDVYLVRIRNGQVRDIRFNLFF